jgi:hypothetical protein
VSRSNCSSNLDPAVNRWQLGREHDAQQAEVQLSDYGREDDGDDRGDPLDGSDPVEGVPLHAPSGAPP